MTPTNTNVELENKVLADFHDFVTDIILADIKDIVVVAFKDYFMFNVWYKDFNSTSNFSHVPSNLFLHIHQALLKNKILMGYPVLQYQLNDYCFLISLKCLYL